VAVENEEEGARHEESVRERAWNRTRAELTRGFPTPDAPLATRAAWAVIVTLMMPLVVPLWFGVMTLLWLVMTVVFLMGCCLIFALPVAALMGVEPTERRVRVEGKVPEAQGDQVADLLRRAGATEVEVRP